MKSGNSNSWMTLPLRLVPWAGLLLLLAAVVLIFSGGPAEAVVAMLYIAAEMLGVPVEPPTVS